MKMLWLDLLSTTLEAEAPSAVRMADLSEMDELLKTVKWLLDVLTPESIDYCCMAIASCTKSAGILKGVVSLLYNRAVLEPQKCHLYAQLCSKLDYKLATFPPDEADGKEIKFRRLLITKCQNVFEGDGELWAEVDQMTALDQELERSEKERLVKLGKLGNIRLIGELWKQKMLTDRIVHSVIQKLLGMDKEGWPSVQNVEAVAQLLRTIGKQSDERLISRQMIDAYLKRLNEMAIDAMGALRVVSTVHSIVLLRANNWEPNPQAGVSKIQSKSEESEENPSDTNDSQEDESENVLKRKTACLLKEYFKEANTGKALRCIEELNSPLHHSEVVKEAISTGLERSTPSTDQVMCLLEYLLAKNVITANDVAYGCASCGYLMDDIGARNPSALHCFGEIMGKLVLVGGLDFGVVEEVLRKTEYDLFRKAVFNATLWAVNFSLSAAARSVLDAQASEIKACMLCCGLF